MTLKEAQAGKAYIIRAVNTQDKELNAFLFSLGCCSGEEIAVVFRRRGCCVVAIKDGRYCIDNGLAGTIAV